MRDSFDKLTALLDRAEYEQQCLNNQILAMAGEPENIEDDILRHQITALLWHNQEIKGYLRMLQRELGGEYA